MTELATASFGQRFKVSVLQQLCAVASVANKGKLVTPYLVESVVNSSGETVYQHTVNVRRQVISEETAATVSAILEEGVSGTGGARNASVPGYKVAAKTGTSQKFDILDANGNSYLRVGSCVAYAPSDDAQVAVIIVVDEPTTAKYGAIVAAPYISSLLTSILPYLELKPTEAGAVTFETVGDYTGLSTAQVKTVFRSSALKYRLIGDGNTILSQFPAAGCELDTSLGSVILYTDGSEKENAIVPTVIGKSPEEANRLLLAAGLNIGILGVRDERHGEGVTVTAQSLPPGESVSLGTIVRITILYPDDSD